MNRYLTFLTLIVLLPTLAACSVSGGTPSVSTSDKRLQPLATPALNTVPCGTCDEATLAALQTQEQNSVENQAAATAEIMRINAQATLDAASSTLSAAQTQEQNNADIIAAQVAATAAIIRADAQATLDAAGATRSAALTQDAKRQTQAAEQAAATREQQNKNDLAASTQTAVANAIATQTQSAVATTQWYADQDRIRNEQWQTPLTVLWLCCLPLFIVLIGLASLWFFLRSMKTREVQTTTVVTIEPKANSPYPLSAAPDHVRGWLEEVKRRLIASEKDDHDNPSR